MKFCVFAIHIFSPLQVVFHLGLLRLNAICLGFLSVPTCLLCVCRCQSVCMSCRVLVDREQRATVKDKRFSSIYEAVSIKVSQAS